VFNLLPGLPLDGGRALESVLWAITGRRSLASLLAGWAGRVVVVGIIVWGLFGPLDGARNITGMVWLLLVAALLWQGAGAAIAQARWTNRVPTASARALMRPAVTIGAAASVASAIATATAGDSPADEGVPADGGGTVVVLDEDGRAIGVLDRASMAAVPPERAADVTVRSVMRALPAATIEVELSGEALLERMRTGPAPLYAVVSGAAVIGLLSWQDVVASLNTGRRTGAARG